MNLSLTSTLTLNNGVEIPRFGLGTYLSEVGAETQNAVRMAMELGYRHVDTASGYNNEQDVAIGIRDSGVPREEVFITTKVWIKDFGYEETLAACAKSLQLMETDYIDLYLIHWPKAETWQPTWRAMETLLKDGQCRAVGVSNFQTYQIDELLAFSELVPAVNQIELSPFNTRAELVNYCQSRNIAVEAYSPLTAGQKLDDPTLVEIAGLYGKSPAQVLIRWALQHDTIVIPKSVSLARLRENADVFDFTLSAQDMARLDGLNEEFYTLPESWRNRFLV